MSVYIAPLQMLDRYGARELAQAGTPDDLPVADTDLLRLRLADGDVSGADANDLEVVDLAINNLVIAIADAEQVIDGHLAARYALPMNPVPTLLRRLAGDIARYMLHDDGATDEITDRYAAALKVLAAIRDGKMSIGVEDPAPSGGSPEVRPGRSRFDADAMHGFDL